MAKARVFMAKCDDASPETIRELFRTGQALLAQGDLHDGPGFDRVARAAVGSDASAPASREAEEAAATSGAIPTAIPEAPRPRVVITNGENPAHLPDAVGALTFKHALLGAARFNDSVAAGAQDRASALRQFASCIDKKTSKSDAHRLYRNAGVSGGESIAANDACRIVDIRA